MRLHVQPEIFRRWPQTALSGVAIRGIDLTAASQLSEIVRAQLLEKQALLKDLQVDHPRIAIWREVYKAFGAKPRSYQCSIERLVTRAKERGTLTLTSPLADIGNCASIRSLLPVGVEDTDRIVDRLELRFAANAEVPVKILGEDTAKSPNVGEVIYADAVSTVCRRWNWRETARACVTSETRNAIFILESVRAEDHDLLRTSAEELRKSLSVVAKSCTAFFVDANIPCIEFDE